MHIYHGTLLLQLSIDAFHTTTPHLADVVTSTGRTPSKIHRCLEYRYTKLCRAIYIKNNAQIPMQIDPPIEHRSLQNHYT